MVAPNIAELDSILKFVSFVDLHKKSQLRQLQHLKLNVPLNRVCWFVHTKKFKVISILKKGLSTSVSTKARRKVQMFKQRMTVYIQEFPY